MDIATEEKVMDPRTKTIVFKMLNSGVLRCVDPFRRSNRLIPTTERFTVLSLQEKRPTCITQSPAIMKVRRDVRHE